MDPKDTKKPLKEADPELHALIEGERERQRSGLELIASENFTTAAVHDCLGSCLTNKYSEGQPGARYYGGNEWIDQIENLCKARALKAFGLDAATWGVNVQPYSGSPANLEVFVGMLNVHDRIMGLDLPSGGHLTHGYQTDKKKISSTSIFYESMPYSISADDGKVDYAGLERDAAKFRPKLLICGGSAYPRDWDYARMRAIADNHGAWLHCDMAHYSGLVAAGLVASPFEHCDVVTSTTHKTLRGPRSGIIFFRKGSRTYKQGARDVTVDYDLEARINFAVFPSLQGGPHNHQIAAVATALKEAATPEFKAYAAQVVANARALADFLKSNGHKLVTDGTDTHLVLWDLKPSKVTGSKFESVCERAHISINKNSVVGDKSAMTPGGARLGTPALTTRGFKEADFVKVGEFLLRALAIAVAVQDKSGAKLADFNKALDGNDDVAKLGADVQTFARSFPMPGAFEL